MAFNLDVMFNPRESQLIKGRECSRRNEERVWEECGEGPEPNYMETG